MNVRRTVQIAMMLALIHVAAYLVAPALRVRIGPHAMLWTDAGLITFGILLIVLSRLLPARRPRS